MLKRFSKLHTKMRRKFIICDKHCCGFGSGSISTQYGTDPAPDPSLIKTKLLEKPLFLLFCDFFMTFIFEKLCKCTIKK